MSVPPTNPDASGGPAGQAARRPRSRARQWLARIWPWLLAVTCLALLAGASYSFYLWRGWRYGSHPLPEPRFATPEGFGQTPLPADPKSNYWHWVRQVPTQLNPQSTSARIFLQTVNEWCQYGMVDQTNRVALREWLRGFPGLHNAYEGACASSIAVAQLPGGDSTPLPLRQERLLRGYSLWLALEAEQDGRTAEAFACLVKAWRLAGLGELSVNPYTVRSWRFERCWRRLALNAPAIPRDAAQAWLAELEEIDRQLAAFAPIYESTLSRNWASLQTQIRRGPRWDEVGRLFNRAIGQIGSEVKMAIPITAERFMGMNAAYGWRPEGFRYLVMPWKTLLKALQHASARREDFDQMLATVASEARFGLTEDDPTPAIKRLDELRATPSDRRAWHDRPAIWRCLGGLPAVQMLWDKVLGWRLDLHSCRVVLALRLYRDEHGSWPAGLDELVPRQLPSPLPVPIRTQLADYRTQDAAWGIWRPKTERKEGEAGDVRLPELARQWSGFVDRVAPPAPFVQTAWLHSGEAAQHRLTWEGLVAANHLRPDGTINPNLLRRYGLRTADNTPSLVTRAAALAQAFAGPRPPLPEVPAEGLAVPASEWGSGPGFGPGIPPGAGGPGRFGLGPPPGGRRRGPPPPNSAASGPGATNSPVTETNAPTATATAPVTAAPQPPPPRPTQ